MKLHDGATQRSFRHMCSQEGRASRKAQCLAEKLARRRRQELNATTTNAQKLICDISRDVEREPEAGSVQRPREWVVIRGLTETLWRRGSARALEERKQRAGMIRGWQLLDSDGAPLDVFVLHRISGRL
jgi:hypothetical protein